MSLLHIYRGVPWATEWPVLDIDKQPVDVSSGWKFRAQVRRERWSDVVYHEWSTDIGNVEMGNGFVKAFVEPDESREWEWRAGYFAVLLESENAGPIPLDSGRILVHTLATR